VPYTEALLSGRYVSLTPGHINEVSEKEYKQLVEDGLMFPPAHTDPALMAAGLAADWPHGRGAYISADEKTVVHVGHIDHVRVISRDPECEYLNLLMDRLEVSLDIIQVHTNLSPNIWGHCPNIYGGSALLYYIAYNGCVYRTARAWSSYTTLSSVATLR